MNTQEKKDTYITRQELLALTMYALSPERAKEDLGQIPPIPPELLDNGSLCLWKLEEALIKASQKNVDEEVPFFPQPFELYQLCLNSIRKSEGVALTPNQSALAFTLPHSCHIAALNFFEMFSFSDDFSAIAKLLNPEELAILKRELAGLYFCYSDRLRRAKCRVLRLLDEEGIVSGLMEANKAFHFFNSVIALQESPVDPSLLENEE